MSRAGLNSRAEEKAAMENLGPYVRRMLREKGLTLSDVTRRAGGEISRGYVCEISRGHLSSPTVRKLQALARGLDVAEDEIFAVARGAPDTDHVFVEARFARLAARFAALTLDDQREVGVLLEALEREVDRRQTSPTGVMWRPIFVRSIASSEGRT
jgi:transcriptional regulator with XRE-family HTH domain